MAPRALITGIAGFTGGYMAAELASRGYEVFGLGKLDGEQSGIDVDLRDIAELNKAVAEIRPEFVVHLAGVAFVAHEDVEEIYSSNIVGTRNLLAAVC